MKILCLCRGGSVRSVTLAHVLKYGLGLDALTASLEKNSPETLDMVCNWADGIMVVEAEMRDQVPMKYQPKVRVFPIGPDIWGASLHGDLMQRISSIFQRVEWATWATFAVKGPVG